MEFLNRRSYTGKDRHKCFYCSQRYPSKRDLAIHEYIHGNDVGDAIFSLTIQPRNNYLVYEEFVYACGKMETGVFVKEVGCAETPEQEENEEKSSNTGEYFTSASQPCACATLEQGRTEEKSSNNEEFDTSASNECETLEEGEIEEKSSNMEEYSESASQPCATLEQGGIGEKSSNAKEFDTSASQPWHSTPHQDVAYRHEFRKDLFAYKTFHGEMPTCDSASLLKSMSDNVPVKYETFPRRTYVKPRDTWADRYKTSLASLTDMFTDMEGNFPIAFSGTKRCGSTIRLEPDFTLDSGSREINV